MKSHLHRQVFHSWTYFINPNIILYKKSIFNVTTEDKVKINNKDANEKRDDVVDEAERKTKMA